MLEAVARQVPTPSVGIRDRTLALCSLFITETGLELGPKGVGEMPQGLVCGCELGIEDGFVLREDWVEVGVVCNVTHFDVRDLPALETGSWIL